MNNFLNKILFQKNQKMLDFYLKIIKKIEKSRFFQILVLPLVNLKLEIPYPLILYINSNIIINN